MTEAKQRIEEAGARMYKGKAYKVGDDNDQLNSGGATPTYTLQDSTSN